MFSLSVIQEVVAITAVISFVVFSIWQFISIIDSKNRLNRD